MTRGRKKDLTIPPTRNLQQQRDYRTRKALYTASLEERCRIAEEENARLRKELAETRARSANPGALLTETASAASELMHHLSLASSSLAEFHRLAFPEVPSPQHSTPLQPELQQPTPPSSACPKSTSSTLSSHPDHLQPDAFADLPRPTLPLPQAPSTPTTYGTPTPITSHDCCGGFFDCDKFCDDAEDKEEDDQPSASMTRMSHVRSTPHDDS